VFADVLKRAFFTMKRTGIFGALLFLLWRIFQESTHLSQRVYKRFDHCTKFGRMANDWHHRISYIYNILVIWLPGCHNISYGFDVSFITVRMYYLSILHRKLVLFRSFNPLFCRFIFLIGNLILGVYYCYFPWTSL
jgi:hypothetical protein